MKDKETKEKNRKHNKQAYNPRVKAAYKLSTDKSMSKPGGGCCKVISSSDDEVPNFAKKSAHWFPSCKV